MNQTSFKVPNLKKWEFVLIYHKACNGVDSVFSDTIGIDETPPDVTDLDSVSVDLLTQKTILGWKANSTPDAKSYIIYYVTGTNQTIKETMNTYYLDPAAGNPAAKSESYSIAATDSCNNSSTIRGPHSTIFLQKTYNQCNKTIELDWSPYVGWSTSDYQIYLKINNGNYKLVGTVVSNINKFTYNFNTFGDTYCFYIRALKSDGSGISSSSNVVCENTSGIKAAKNSYIAKASVRNNLIDLVLVTETGTSMQKINIFKKEENGNFNAWQTLNFTGGTLSLSDASVNVHSKSYSYYYTTEGPCNLIFDSSQIAKTILLHVSMLPNNNDLNWNLYSDFIKNTNKQELLLSDNANFNYSSPWNILNTFGSSTFTTSDNTSFGVTQQKICYCIRAIENNPSGIYNRQDSSYSNVECLTADPIIYFPNAIQLNGYNVRFVPKGVFVDSTKSNFKIYNRWGEVIFETYNIFEGWDGTYNGSLVDSDVYAYRAEVIGINGKILYFDGTITVLK